MTRNKVVRIALAFVCLAAFALPLAGQQVKSSPGIPGYLDPQTGSFKPAAALPAVEANTAAVVYTHGTLVFNFTITVASTFPSGTNIYCTASALTYSAAALAAGGEIMESATVAATRGAGSAAGTATCRVTIPYSWNEAQAGSTVNLSFGIDAVGPAGTLITNSGAASTRSTSHPIGSIPLPAVGATTTETITATI